MQENYSKKRKIVDSHDHPNGSLIQDRRKLLKKSWTVKIRHACKEGNKYVDKLVALGYSFDFVINYVMNPPLDLLLLLNSPGSTHNNNK